MTIALRLLPALPLAALLLASAAQAETSVGAMASAEAGYSNNPYLNNNAANLDTASLTLVLAPSVVMTGPTSEVGLSGRIEQTFYAAHYNDLTNWSLGAAGDLTLSPRSNLTLNANYASNVNNGLNTIFVPGGPEDGEEIPSPLPDPSSAEVAGQRTKILGAGAAFTTILSPRDSLSINGRVAKADYPAAFGSGYVTYAAGVGLSHAFSEKLSAGGSVNYSRSDYDRVDFNSSEQISPSANLELLLSPRTRLAVSAGVTLSSQSGINAQSGTQVYFAGNASLCHSGVRSNLCAEVSQSVGATTQAGSSRITSAGASYSYRLTSSSNIQLGAQYSKTKSVDLGPNLDTGYASANLGYSRQIRRFYLTASARYTNPFKSLTARSSSFYAGVGVSYRLGR